MTIISFWVGVVAIFVGAAGIWRAEQLFDELNENVKELIANLKDNMLKQAETVFASYSSFSRSLQFVDLKAEHLPPDGAFALLTVFYLQRSLYAKTTDQEYAELRTRTRKNIEDAAAGYVKMLVKSGLATMKPGFELPPDE